MSSDKPHVQEELLELRDFEVKDYQGILALTIAVGGFIIVVITIALQPHLVKDVLVGVLPLVAGVVGYYGGRKAR